MRNPRSLALLALLACAAGCGNNPYPPGETSGSVLYRAISDDPRTLDPSVSYVVTEATIVDLIYPSFFQYHYLKRDPFVLELALGAEEPKREPYPVTVTEGGRTVTRPGERWTFTIKRGLRFQDDPCFAGGKGREVTAADFIYSFRRMADPSVPCPVLAFFEDKILGLDAYVARNRARSEAGQKADYAAEVPGLLLDPKDPYVFRLVLKQPYPQLRYLMAMHFTTPIAREAAERYGQELARHPVGCGPFRLTEYVKKQRIVLTVNPNRHEEFYPSEGERVDAERGLLKDAGKRLPLVDTIVYNVIREGVTGWNLFLQGYQDTWSVTQENYQQAMSSAGQLSPEMVAKGVRLLKAPQLSIGYFGFNMKDPVVGGTSERAKKLRQAISLSVDAQAHIDLFNQGNGIAAQSIIPPGLFGYEPEYKNPYRQYDVAKAKQRLAEAGYPKGIDPKSGERLTIWYDNTATTAAGRQAVGLIKKQVEAIGIRLESRSWRGIIWQDKIDKGQFQFFSYGWLADYPDPENFVFLLYGPNRRPGPNACNYDNPEYNRLFEQMRAMNDGPERLALIRRMRDIAAEECPWIYLDHDLTLALTYDWVRNVKPHPVANDSGKYVGVDGPRRARMQGAWNPPNYWPGLAGLLFLTALSIPAVRSVRERGRRRARERS
jgi:oligopeptide transport system substrate-binding protein